MVSLPNIINTIITKVTSRKFIVTITFGILALISKELELDSEQLWQIAAIVGPYLGIQGLIDLKNGGK